MSLLFVAWFVLLLGALIAAGTSLLPKGGGRWAIIAGSGGAIIACLCGLIAAGGILLAGGDESFTRPWAMPGGAFSLHLDPLAAFFLLPLFIVGLAGALYGAEYMDRARSSHASGHGVARRPVAAGLPAAGGMDAQEAAGTSQAGRMPAENEPQQDAGPLRDRAPGLHWAWYNLLLLAMSLVLTAANGLLFLLAWECMSLTSFMLVINEHDLATAVEAGWTYLVATHLGAAFLFAFFLTAGAMSGGSLEFTAFTGLAEAAAPLATVLFLLLLIGFGSKAGIFPFHVWLPDAHPAAPSHVSALMSGVMVKTAIYGLLRFVSLLPPAPAWWGGLLMAIGITGALFGIAMAALQADIKRSLAYSTVENIGIILLALGFWMQSRAAGHQLAAALALAGGLIHLLNHALFKSLLFLGAGSLVHASGSRNLDRMGGLMRRLPRTGLLLVGGGLAISALPPFNGLVGEWFIYRALLESGGSLSGLAGFFPLVLIGLLALVGGLVLLVMTRIIGIALGGEPRSRGAVQAQEAGWPMQSGMALLALLCLFGGLLPLGLLHLAGRAAGVLDGSAAAMFLESSVGAQWLGWLAALLICGLLLVALFSRWRSGRLPAAAAATWGCGYALPSSRMAYSAESYSEFAQSAMFCDCLQPAITAPGPKEMTKGTDLKSVPGRFGRPWGFFPANTSFALSAADPLLDKFYQPLLRRLAGLCCRCRVLQSGRLHIYLLYIFSATILLLVWVGRH